MLNIFIKIFYAGLHVSQPKLKWLKTNSSFELVRKRIKWSWNPNTHTAIQETWKKNIFFLLLKWENRWQITYHAPCTKKIHHFSFRYLFVFFINGMHVILMAVVHVINTKWDESYKSFFFLFLFFVFRKKTTYLHKPTRKNMVETNGWSLNSEDILWLWQWFWDATDVCGYLVNKSIKNLNIELHFQNRPNNLQFFNGNWPKKKNKNATKKMMRKRNIHIDEFIILFFLQNIAVKRRSVCSVHWQNCQFK